MSASASLHSISDSEVSVSAEARISQAMKRDAEKFLAEHGLTLNDAFKMTIEAASMRMGVPSYWIAPNAETREAMAELDNGTAKSCNSVAELMADLHAND